MLQVDSRDELNMGVSKKKLKFSFFGISQVKLIFWVEMKLRICVFVTFF